MRKLVYYVAVTLDGRIAGPGGGDPSGMPYFPITEGLVAFITANYPETLPGPARDAMGVTGSGRHFDTVLEGRASYELGTAAGLPDAYPHLRHLVFSSTLEVDPSLGIEVVRDGALDRVRELKAEDGLDLWLVGGAKLAHSLLPEIDRLVLKQNPHVIGDGVPLFDGPFSEHAFNPVDTVELPGGVRVVTFDRA